MKNIELQDLLKEFPDDLEVVLPARANEGDGVNELTDVRGSKMLRDYRDDDDDYNGVHELVSDNSDDEDSERVIVLSADE